MSVTHVQMVRQHQDLSQQGQAQASPMWQEFQYLAVEDQIRGIMAM